MKKVIRLTESDLRRIVKKVIKESTMAPEPVPTGAWVIGKVYFDEGDYTMSENNKNSFIEGVKRVISPSIDTIHKFYNSEFKLPNMFEINVGTSSTGTADQNSNVGRKRKELMMGVIERALEDFKIKPDTIEQILNAVTTSSYQPSKVDKNFYDVTKIKGNDRERFASLKVRPITTMGLNPDQISAASYKIQSGDVTKSKKVKNEDDIWNLWGWAYDSGYHTEEYTEPNENTIYDGVRALKTYSDVKDINTRLKEARRGGLAKVINDKITDNGKWLDSCYSLKKAFKRSGYSESQVDCRTGKDLYIEF